MPQIQKKKQQIETDLRHPIAEDTHRSHHLPKQVLDHLVPDIPTTPDQARTTEHNTFEEIPQQDNPRFPDFFVHMLLMFTNMYYNDYKGQALLLSHLIGQAGSCMDKMCPSWVM